MTIRDAVPDDAPWLAAVQVAGWRSGYRGIVPDATLDALDVVERTAQWREWLERDETRTLAAAPDGFVTLREPVGEIAALYVAPARAGQGLGSALLDAAHAALARAGHDRVTLWVFAANDHARAFYAARGYVPDGATTVEHGLECVRLHRPLP